MEESLLKSDIFFFITTLVVVVLGVLGSVIFIYGIKIFRDLSFLAHKARIEGEEILKDAREVREGVKSKIETFISIIGALLKFKNRRRK